MTPLRWRLGGSIERRQEPREAATSPESEAEKAKLRAQVATLEDEIRTVLLELEAGVYTRDQWRETNGWRPNN